MNKLKYVLTVLLLATPQIAHSSDFGDRTWFGGLLGAGYQSLTTTAATNTSKTGILFNEKAYAEYRSENTGAFGLGIGGQQTIQQGSTTQRLQQLTISTLLVDVSYLYPIFGDTFWIGALVSTQSGPGALFNFSDLQSTQYLISAGPQLRFLHHGKSLDYLAGADFLYALDSPGQTIWSVPVYVGVLFHLGNDPKPTPKTAPIETPAAVVEKREPSSVPQTKVVVTFDVDKTTIKPMASELLDRVSKVLLAQKDNWKSVQISGHADPTGKAAHNLAISNARAKQVLKTLVLNGVPKGHLSAEGFGAKQPIPGQPRNAEAHRRVELTFNGVLDSEKFYSALAATMNASHDASNDASNERNPASDTSTSPKNSTPHGITFASNKANLKPQSVALIKQAAQILVEQKVNCEKIHLSGYSDPTGNTKTNLVLSKKRAQAVLAEFVKNGIPADRVSAQGYGSENRISGQSVNSEAQRRVEISCEGGLSTEQTESALKSIGFRIGDHL